MFLSKSSPVALVIGLVAFAAHAHGATPAVGASTPAGSSGPASTAMEANRPVLRIQLVVSRFEGEKKMGSLPYAFVVTPDTPNQMHIRFGVEAPVPSPNFTTDAGKPGPVEYRNLGTNIDCYNVHELSGGRYQFDINVQNSAALPGDGSAKDARPLFRRFESSFTAVLRDGQTMQTITSTNPVTGEVVRIDVTLNVVR